MKTRTLLLVSAAALLMSFGLSGCSDDATAAGGDTSTSGGDASASSSSRAGEKDGLEYSDIPADLTAEEVCALLDGASIADHLGTEVIEMRAGSYQADCHWSYRLESGTLTNLHVQVMTSGQTGNRLGTEALERAMEAAPPDAEISEVDSLEAPSRSYEFNEATVIFAIDSAGRIVTVSASGETPEESRVALTEMVLDALAQNYA